jgi:hypothetical protein
LIVDLNVSEQITNFKPLHPDAPFSSPFAMMSSDFESMWPLCFTSAYPIPLVLPSHKPLDGIELHYHCIAKYCEAEG